MNASESNGSYSSLTDSAARHGSRMVWATLERTFQFDWLRGVYASRSCVDQGWELALELPSGEIADLLEGCLGSLALPLTMALAVLVVLFAIVHPARRVRVHVKR